MLEIENISAGYLSETILRDFSLSVKQGEIVGIFGPNGAGKTTLLCSVNGLARVTKGSVRIGGRLFSRRSASVIRKKIGYAPQHFEIDPRIPASARDVVLMGVYGMKGIFSSPGKGEKKHLEELAGTLEITGLLDKPFGLLSGGEKQKTLIARALIQKPEILLLDEIFAWIDSSGRAHILELLKKLHLESGLTTMLVSHDPGAAGNILTRIIRLENSKIVFDGKPCESGLPLCCTN